MIVENYDGKDERTILTALIVSDEALAKIAPKYEGEMFTSRSSNTIARWCCDYYKRYNKAPRHVIGSLFSDWASSGKDRDTVKLVEEFLSSLSGEYERLSGEVNPNFVCDLAGKHFNRVRASRLKDSLEVALAANDLDRVDALINKYTRVELGSDAGADIFLDDVEIDTAFAETDEGFFTYGSGALAEFMGDVFGRDTFVSFLAPEGTGKSWMLMDTAFRAMCARRKVAYFECGDMSKTQVKRRFYARAARRPWRAKTIRIPQEITISKTDPIVTFATREFTEPLEKQAASAACRKIMKSKVKSKHSYFKLSCHETSTLSVKKLKGILDNWDRQGWVPDVVVCDYADLMPPSRNYEKKIDQIESVWEDLRALSLARHCCIVTATQSTRPSYEAWVLGKQHVSECKKKTAYVTALIGINQTDKEKVNQVFRFNLIKLRSEDYVQNRVVYVAGCLAIANPCLRSTF